MVVLGMMTGGISGRSASVALALPPVSQAYRSLSLPLCWLFRSSFRA